MAEEQYCKAKIIHEEIEQLNLTIMKTIEERATEYARTAQNCEKCGEDDCLQENFRCDHFRRVYYAFVNGAKAQKEIDIEWLKAHNVLTDASLEGFRKTMQQE